MSNHHESDTEDYPIYTGKPAVEVKEGPTAKANRMTSGETSRDDRMVQLGRGENIAGRQKGR